MKRMSYRYLLPLLLFASLAACRGEGSELSQKMDSSERKFNAQQRSELVAFMSLEAMFPDPQARALAEAAGRGDSQKIDLLVKQGVSVNVRGAQGVTPLFWAMRDYGGFERLLELGADPNVVFADGNSVMLAAVKIKDQRILKSALEHGGNPNLVAGDSTGRTPIFDAIGVGMDVVDLLISHGANINARDSLSNTPLLTAAGRNDFETVYQLLERGADYSVRDRHGYDLAKQVASTVGKLSPGTKWARWQERVIEWLRAKGVEV